MAQEITATLVVRFGSTTDTLATNGTLILQVDDRPDGLNSGNTSNFTAGSNVGMLLYRSNNIENIRLFRSIGRTRAVGSGSRSITEVLTFLNSDSAQLSFPISGSSGVNWLGNSGGSFTIENQRTVKLTAKATAVLEITYNTNFQEFILDNTPGQLNGSTNYTVVVTAVGTVK